MPARVEQIERQHRLLVRRTAFDAIIDGVRQEPQQHAAPPQRCQRLTRSADQRRVNHFQLAADAGDVIRLEHRIDVPLQHPHRRHRPPQGGHGLRRNGVRMPEQQQVRPHIGRHARQGAIGGCIPHLARPEDITGAGCIAIGEIDHGMAGTHQAAAEFRRDRMQERPFRARSEITDVQDAHG